MLRPRPVFRLAPAREIMRGLNPNALAAAESGLEIFIEDIADTDGRLYRMEYRCQPSGAAAMAYCLHNPWGPASIAITDSHLMSDNSICNSPQSHRGGDDLAYTVERTRFWCTGYSFLREHGITETRRILGTDW